MRGFLGRSFIYLGATFAMRGLGLVLVPVYSHFLPPPEYGIYGLAITFGLLLAMVMSFGTVSAVGRFYFDNSTEDQRKATLGTIFLLLVFAPLAIALFLDIFGPSLFNALDLGIAYRPYLRIATWTTYFSTFSVLPLMVLRSEERATAYALLGIGQAVLYHGLSVLFVAVLRWGVLGLLLGNLVSTLLIMPIYLHFTFRAISLRVSWSRMREILRYSLPLVPHSLANWALTLSDRVVLARFGTLANVGVYSLGYTIGSASQNVAEAATTAWFPSFYRAENSGTERETTLRAATYLLAGVCAFALIITVWATQFVRWFLPVSYAGADRVVFWVAVSGIFVMMYSLWSQSVHFAKGTAYLPAISWTASAVNIGLNLVLVPRLGYMAAAVNTAVAYGILAILGMLVARRLHPVAFDYRRWGVVVGFTAVLSTLSYVRPPLNELLDAIYSFALIAAWPIGLGMLGFYCNQEKTEGHILWGRFRFAVAKRLHRIGNSSLHH